MSRIICEDGGSEDEQGKDKPLKIKEHYFHYCLTIQYTASLHRQESTELILNEKDVAKLMKLLCKFSYMWDSIGVMLGFLPTEITTIRSMPLLLPSAPTSYLLELLTQWVQWPTESHPSVPTLRTLCDSLKSSPVGLCSLAEEVEEEMKQATGKIPIRGSLNSLSACLKPPVLTES